MTQALAQIYYIHTDHLNTPRAIYDQQQRLVWRWDQTDPFGANAPNENPLGLGTFTCNLRLPGQYFDRETNLLYNYFRDYDPAIGRYVQSDPTGLAGGTNTYAYVGTNPILYFDPLRQDRWGDRDKDPWYPRAGKNPPFHVRPDGNPWSWGCGDKETDHLIPDIMWGVNVTSACRSHDSCYERACEPGISKEKCDNQIFEDVIRLCRAAGKPIAICRSVAWQYYQGVHRGGDRSFSREKRKCCGP